MMLRKPLRSAMLPALRPAVGVGAGSSILAKVAALFHTVDQGAWHEPSLTNATNYQDSAGAAPVSAWEQLLGLMLDKSGGGENAVQATAGLKPRITARMNLLTKTEDFTQWGYDAGGVPAANAAMAPNNTMTASVVTVTAANTVRQSVVKAAANNTYVGRVWIKRLSGVPDLQIRFVANGGVLAPTLVTPNLPLNEWVLVSTTGQSGSFADLRFDITSATAGSYAIWAGQLEIGSVATRYQRVNTAVDYDTAGFPSKAEFDNVDDAHVTTFATALGSNCTVVRSVAGVGTTILTGQTIGTTYTNTVTHSGLLIIDRPLTAAETLAVTRWGNQRAGV